MGDAFVYHFENFENEFLFENRQYGSFPDQNNGNYPSGRIRFDLGSLSNSGKYTAWDRSYLAIPLVANLEVVGMSTSSIENTFSVSLKNGCHHLINSIDVQITNNSVTNLTNFSNLDINYRILSSSCKEDEENRLPSMGFFKYSVESVSYQLVGANGNGAGIGETNNAKKFRIFINFHRFK